MFYSEAEIEFRLKKVTGSRSVQFDWSQITQGKYTYTLLTFEDGENFLTVYSNKTKQIVVTRKPPDVVIENLCKRITSKKFFTAILDAIYGNVFKP